MKSSHAQAPPCAHPESLQENIMTRTHFKQPPADPGFELYFPSLSLARPALSFPCSASGAVPLDSLSERARNNYRHARALMGCDYATPTVRASVLH
jgi:hypothetical protein